MPARVRLQSGEGNFLLCSGEMVYPLFALSIKLRVFLV